MNQVNDFWPKAPTMWTEDRTLYVSIPFSWDLPGVRDLALQSSYLWDKIVVGGPAVDFLPHFFDGLAHVETGREMPGVLQRVYPLATKTTRGCPNKCSFCAVPRIGRPYQELDDWPDLPNITDNNLLAASPAHIDKVFDRLERHIDVDFSQGLDIRFLNEHHAERLSRLANPMIRLALDHSGFKGHFLTAYELLRKHGIAKHKIRVYALVGYDSGPAACWDRCNWIENLKLKALPMWYHELDAMEKNVVTPAQEKLGWTDFERRRIMYWFYKHREVTE